ncbi:hypothetical protein O0I10_000413 [Lichtheimia ornata]|uniref:Uncharacterized protein n=1 Tax=Lichtheimia ornata TaxID=688661 RepID=A0AAD7Y5A3_9FUNG|nr:uncharacterized protein O0I10_000413 [Lichtheimia ornata]KAJ8664134.1 hypothetical protein O0I10_000413 [Lichtheimia ornata]
MNVFYEWIVSATNNSIHIFGAISTLILIHLVLPIACNLVNLLKQDPPSIDHVSNKEQVYTFGVSKLLIISWLRLSAIPLMDLYNYTRLMDGPCHQQAMRTRVDIFGVTKVIYASPQGIHRQAAFDFQ